MYTHNSTINVSAWLFPNLNIYKLKFFLFFPVGSDIHILYKTTHPFIVAWLHPLIQTVFPLVFAKAVYLSFFHKAIAIQELSSYKM